MPTSFIDSPFTTKAEYDAWVAAGADESATGSSGNNMACVACVGAPCLAPNLVAGKATGAYPPWHPVAKSAKSRQTGLMVLNSLTGEKVPFVPREGNRVNWYTCGPTVYDACHMGHARAYVTMDIMRRILEDYFNYEVFLQVNVTDIDDKIILRARRNKLIADYVASGKSLEQAKKDVTSAANAFETKLLAKLQKLQKPLDSRREEEERKELLAQQEHKVCVGPARAASAVAAAAAAPSAAVRMSAAATAPLSALLQQRLPPHPAHASLPPRLLRRALPRRLRRSSRARRRSMRW